MTVATREDRLVEELRRAYGLSEEQARRLLPRLHRLQVLDTVAVDEDDEGDEIDFAPHGDAKSS